MHYFLTTAAIDSHDDYSVPSDGHRMFDTWLLQHSKGVVQGISEIYKKVVVETFQLMVAQLKRNTFTFVDRVNLYGSTHCELTVVAFYCY